MKNKNTVTHVTFSCNIQADNMKLLMKELTAIFEDTKDIHTNNVCRSCKCQVGVDGCQQGGGGSEPGLTSTWNLTKYVQRKTRQTLKTRGVHE